MVKRVVTHGFLGSQTCLVYICLFILVSFRLFIFMGRFVLMLEENPNVVVNRKKGGKEKLKWCENKKLTLCFL